MDDILRESMRCPTHPDAGPLHPLPCRRDSHAGPGAGQGLVCPRCGRLYPVRGDIPDFLLPDESFGGFRDREIRQWDEQAATYDEERLRDPIYRAGIAAAAAALRPRPGERILDAGCGTGLTLRRYYRPGIRVVALDLSLASLRLLRQCCKGCAVSPVRADLTRLPFATGFFDRVLCANALQHIPGTRLRQACIQELARVVRPGGTVVVTTHNYSLPKQRAAWQKEGSARGPSGEVQYIYRYEAAEFHTLLSSALRVNRVRGAGLPLWYRWKLSGVSGLLERWLLCRLPFSAQWAHMLVGTGRKAS